MIIGFLSCSFLIEFLLILRIRQSLVMKETVAMLIIHKMLLMKNQINCFNCKYVISKTLVLKLFENRTIDIMPKQLKF